MIVEVLYFDGCPHHAATMDAVRQLAVELAIEAEIREVEVRGDEDAQRLRFLGSPTIRVNGADIEPSAHERADYALCCRLYGGSGVPSRDLLAAALRNASD